jgi:hypothetical protein
MTRRLPEAVTHEDLQTGIAVLKSMAEDRDRVIGGLRSDIRTVATDVSTVKIEFSSLKEVLGQEREAINRLSQSIDSLTASEHRREGRDGVWSAILRSPAMAWIVGALAAVGAFLTGKNGLH